MLDCSERVLFVIACFAILPIFTSQPKNKNLLVKTLVILFISKNPSYLITLK